MLRRYDIKHDPIFANRTRLRLALMFVLLGLIAVGTVPRAAQADPVEALAHQVKAAMLYKFLGYIEWPETAFTSSNSPYVIAVYGANDIAAELAKITRNRTINNRPIEVIELSSFGALGKGIHMVFVGDVQQHRLRRLLALAEEHPIVTVTDSERGLAVGSTINLRLIDGRIRFDVSLADSQERNIRVSARMLAVASSVRKGEQ